MGDEAGDRLLDEEWRALREGDLVDLARGDAAQALLASPHPGAPVRLARYEQLAGADRRAHDRLDSLLREHPVPPGAEDQRALGVAFEPTFAPHDWSTDVGEEVSLRYLLAVIYARLARDGIEPATGWTGPPSADSWDAQLALVERFDAHLRAILERADPDELAHHVDIAVYAPHVFLAHSFEDRAIVCAEAVRTAFHGVGIRALDPYLDYAAGVSLTAAARIDEAAGPLEAAARGFRTVGNSGWWLTARGTQYLLSVMTHTSPPDELEEVETELLTGDWRRNRRMHGHGMISAAAVMLAGHGDLDAARRVATSEGGLDELYFTHNNRAWVAEVLATAAVADGDDETAARMERIVAHMMPSPWQRAIAERLRALRESEDATPVREADGGIHFEVMRTRWLSLARAVERGHRPGAFDALAEVEEFATRARVAALRVRAVQLFRPPDPAGGIELSTRELEVATLAAAGLTNREIATELFLGVRTVEGYVAKAMRALGVSRRADLDAAVLPVHTPDATPDLRLTLRQGQVGMLVAVGASNSEIATTLGISDKTVEKHVAVLKDRLAVSTRTGIVQAFRAVGATAA